MAQKRLRCKTCSTNLTPWGSYPNGKKRYRCTSCGTSRPLHLSLPSQPILFDLFKQYVLWGDTYERLSSLSGYSLRHLERSFHQFFLKEPPQLPPFDQSTSDVAYLLIDGLWFGRWFVLMVYRQSKTLLILHISIAGREVSTKIARDLRAVRERGYIFTGVVSDGGTGIVGGVTLVFPHIPHQICLAHMHRDVINALGRYPKDERVKQLKKLADHIWLIESKAALSWWDAEVKQWVKTHWSFLWEYREDIEGNRWYIHKGVRKAARILLRLPKTSFVFLTHPTMPKTTNELEAQLGHLGKRWLAHRGLKRERWERFLQWFVYFYNLDKLSSRKQR